MQSKSLTSFLFLLWIGSFFLSVSAQDTSSVFSYKKGKFSNAYAMENPNLEEPFMIAFKFNSYFDFYFFNDEMEVLRSLKTEPLPFEVWKDKNEIEAMINSEKELFVFMENVSSHNTTLLIFDKETGDFQTTTLQIDAHLEAHEVKADLVKVFSYQDRFYKV